MFNKMILKKRNIFDIILNIILILLTILVVYWFIKLIFGGSQDLSEFNFGLIVLLAGFFIKIFREVGEMQVEIKHMSIGVKEGFNRIKEDSIGFKGDMDSIKKDLSLIKDKLFK